MSLVDYSNMEKEIADAPEAMVLPRGTEVKFRIIDMMTGESDKNGATWYMPVFDVPAEPLVIEFKDFFWDLADLDKLSEKQAARTLRKFRLFATAIDLDYATPFSWVDDLIGMEGWAILGVKKDDEYGDSNSISKYVAMK